MITTRHFLTRSLLATAVSMAFATSAFAQVRQIQMNNPMDANPGIGTGGANNPVPGYVPINGNDVMTGNVSGLGYFHGSSGGISSQYSFRAPLPSSSLGNFARQSAPQAPNGAMTSYYLPSSTVSTGQGSLYSAPIGSGFQSRLVPVTSYNPTTTNEQLRALNAAVSGQAINLAPTHNIPQLAPTAPGGVLSNPLFVARATEEIERLRREQLKNAAATRPVVDPIDKPTTQPTLQVQELVSGSRMPPIMNRSPEARGDVALDQSVSGNVGEIYARLAEDLKQAQGLNVQPDVPKPLEVKAAPSEIDPLTGRPRLLANSAPTGLPATMPGGATTLPGRGGKPEKGAVAALSAKSLENLPTSQLAAGSKVKPLKMTPATSATPAAFDLQMIRGEQALKEGKFIDAEIAYQTALAQKPNDPLALIGMAHAELAAGAYMPAAYDLKFMFTRKPEMVAVRFDPTSFIPASRHEFLLNDLLRQSNVKETANTASFLYCYLCYQIGRNDLLDAELKRWGARDNKDSWQSVLQCAWRSEPK